MATQSLFKAGAFGSGADLWIIPHASQSEWSGRIDWYLNFLLSRAKIHKTQSIPEELLEIVNENDLEVEGNFRLENKPLLIASEKRFPNKQVVELPKIPDEKMWLNEAFSVWQQMKEPTLRIFLPGTMTETEFQNLWPGDLKREFITLVPNSASNS